MKSDDVSEVFPIDFNKPYIKTFFVDIGATNNNPTSAIVKNVDPVDKPV